MLLTATTILIFFIVAVAAIGIGHFSEHIDLYFFGVVIMLFMGLFILQNGIAEKVGENVTLNTTATLVANVTTTTESQSIVNVYNTEQDVYTTGLGLLSVLIAAGLSLTYFSMRKKKKHDKLSSLELEDD